MSRLKTWIGAPKRRMSYDPKILGQPSFYLADGRLLYMRVDDILKKV